jgi:clan AA aspartic protease (TIGR02281 family)
MAVLIVCAGVIVYTSRDALFTKAEVSETVSSRERETNDNGNRSEQSEYAAAMSVEPDDQSVMKDNVSEHKKNVIRGWVTITDPWGRQVTKVRAGLAGNGWIALPARACIGGNRWDFDPDSGEQVRISGGLWVYGDKVGLWHLDTPSGNDEGPGLIAWNKRESVSWSSLESETAHHSVILTPGKAEGYFVSASLPENINETGIFLQNGNVVGWSFGSWLPNGYMWTGKPGTELTYRTWVSSFYNITFANGREEKFAAALALKNDDTGLEQLGYFINGFRLRPKLLREETPQQLMRDEIIKKMRALVAGAIKRGYRTRIADMFSSEVLIIIGDISLFIDIIPAIAGARGYEAAINEIEDSGMRIVQQIGRDVPELSDRHLELYRTWLQSLVTEKAVDQGWQVYSSAKEYYPDDPYLHLFGVELEILYGNWEEAERLLNMKSYPPELQDRAQLLADQISEMKGQEEKIVIRFPPGSNRIPVTAVINGTVYQDFLVDTGASLVTIPSAAAGDLGLKITQGPHGGPRTVWTAGGAVTATEVIIDEIEINGWVEYNVKALVLDMPDRPELGLLGLNYLGRFQMDLDTDGGTLMLMPR